MIVQLLPPSAQDYVSADHLSRFIVALVRESLDLSAIDGSLAARLHAPSSIARGQAVTARRCALGALTCFHNQNGTCEPRFKE
jgi:hypothetical protein